MMQEIEQALHADGIAGNTYVVFSSDNGLHTGEYRLTRARKADSAFYTDIHVLLVVYRFGSANRPDTSTNALAENIDLAKTFSAIGGAKMHNDGHSLLALLHGHEPSNWRNAVLIEHRAPRKSIFDPDYQQPASGQPTSYEAMRTRTFLYVEYLDGEIEYYDLQNDPFELHNIANELSPLRLLALHEELSALRALPRRWR